MFILCVFHFSYIFAFVKIINFVLVSKCIFFWKIVSHERVAPRSYIVQGPSTALKQPWESSIFIIHLIFSCTCDYSKELLPFFMRIFLLILKIISSQDKNTSFAFDLIHHITSGHHPAIYITARYPFTVFWRTRLLDSVSGPSEDQSLLKTLKSWKECRGKRRNCGARLYQWEIEWKTSMRIWPVS